MQEYLRIKLVELASVPERDEVLGRIARRLERIGTDVTAEQILTARDVDRR